jgi:hypothetical protein
VDRDRQLLTHLQEARASLEEADTLLSEGDYFAVLELLQEIVHHGNEAIVAIAYHVSAKDVGDSPE